MGTSTAVNSASRRLNQECRVLFDESNLPICLCALRVTLQVVETSLDSFDYLLSVVLAPVFYMLLPKTKLNFQSRGWEKEVSSIKYARWMTGNIWLVIQGQYPYK